MPLHLLLTYMLLVPLGHEVTSPRVVQTTLINCSLSAKIFLLTFIYFNLFHDLYLYLYLIFIGYACRCK